MFSAISKAAGFLLGWGSTGARQDDEEKPASVSPEVTKAEPDSLGIRGKVTSLHNDYGIINKDIYFSFGRVVGCIQPKVGSVVNVLATRKSADDGWRAEQVSVVSGASWDDEDVEDAAEETEGPGIVSDTIVGKVTAACNKGSQGFVDNDISFDSDAFVGDYIPFRGDMVVCKVERDGTNGTCRAVNVAPLRTKDFNGEINSAQDGFGYINGDIYIHYTACNIASGCVLRKGEKVSGKAIESNQGLRCNWRAVNITKLSSHGLSARLLQMSRLPTSPMQGRFMQELLEDNQKKHGVFVTKSADFGVMMMGQQKSLQLWIRNESDKPHTLLRVHCHGHNTSQFTVCSPEMKGKSCQPSNEDKKIIVLEPSMSAAVGVDCHTKNLGQEKQLLVFEFDGFKIGRYLTVDVKDPTSRLLEPTTPYQRQGGYKYSLAEQLNRRSSGEGWIVPGIRPIFSSRKNVQLPNRLSQYPIPNDLRRCISCGEDPTEVYPVMKQPLMFSTYTQKFSLLLHLEETQMEIDMREYDLARVCLRPAGEFLGLKVPGLAEGRPSLLIGDKVILSEPGDEDGPQYEGYIHEVFSDEVLLKFQQSFHSDFVGQDYNVEFTFNRTPLRRCHQSIGFVQKLGEEILFPSKFELKHSQVAGKINEAVKDVLKSSTQPTTQPKTTTRQHTFFNPILNTRQKAACLRILGGQCRPLPYILFGPPGTGKSVTVVEAVLQVFHHVSSSRIIVCAPSNSAADLLAERLCSSGKVGKGDLVRLNAFQRSEDIIPEVIQPFSMYADDLERVARHRIVISTCATAGSFYGLRLPPGHFTHAFIDEAGQATEPECMVVLGLVANAGGQVILAGDPMQLGPVLRSQYSKNYGLQESLLERLSTRQLYQRDEEKFAGHGCYDPFLVTKLINNYRSHPALMALPSQLFYHDELQMCADKEMTERMCHTDMLPNPEAPLIFHGVVGEDLREGNSPSWFNPVEAMQVMTYLQRLVGHGLKCDDIGVITPYRKQVEKIRLLIDRLDTEKVKVGSVEEFQGQERLAMIISTVRSHSRLVAFDQKYNLGFLSNPKRFNVAITRPQALLIVIGNPHVLAQDPYWMSLLRYCVENQCYTGCDLPVGLTVTSLMEPGQSQEAPVAGDCETRIVKEEVNNTSCAVNSIPGEIAKENSELSMLSVDNSPTDVPKKEESNRLVTSSAVSNLDPSCENESEVKIEPSRSNLVCQSLDNGGSGLVESVYDNVEPPATTPSPERDICLESNIKEGGGSPTPLALTEDNHDEVKVSVASTTAVPSPSESTQENARASSAEMTVPNGDVTAVGTGQHLKGDVVQVMTHPDANMAADDHEDGSEKVHDEVTGHAAHDLSADSNHCQPTEASEKVEPRGVGSSASVSQPELRKTPATVEKSVVGPSPSARDTVQDTEKDEDCGSHDVVALEAIVPAPAVETDYQNDDKSSTGVAISLKLEVEPDLSRVESDTAQSLESESVTSSAAAVTDEGAVPPPSRDTESKCSDPAIQNRNEFDANSIKDDMTTVSGNGTQAMAKMAGVSNVSTPSCGRGRGLSLLAQQYRNKADLENFFRRPGGTMDVCQSVSGEERGNMGHAMPVVHPDDGGKIGQELVRGESTEQTDAKPTQKPASPEQQVLDFINSVYRRSHKARLEGKEISSKHGAVSSKNDNPPRSRLSRVDVGEEEQREEQKPLSGNMGEKHRKGKERKHQVPPRCQKQVSADVHCDVHADVMPGEVRDGARVQEEDDDWCKMMSQKQFENLPPRFQKKLRAHATHQTSGTKNVCSKGTPSPKAVHNGMEGNASTGSREKDRHLSNSLQAVSKTDGKNCEQLSSRKHGNIRADVGKGGDTKCRPEPALSLQDQFDKLPCRLQRLGFDHLKHWQAVSTVDSHGHCPGWDSVTDERKMKEAQVITGEGSTENGVNSGQGRQPGAYPWPKHEDHVTRGQKSRMRNEVEANEHSWYQTSATDWPGATPLDQHHHNRHLPKHHQRGDKHVRPGVGNRNSRERQQCRSPADGNKDLHRVPPSWKFNKGDLDQRAPSKDINMQGGMSRGAEQGAKIQGEKGEDRRHGQPRSNTSNHASDVSVGHVNEGSHVRGSRDIPTCNFDSFVRGAGRKHETDGMRANNLSQVEKKESLGSQKNAPRQCSVEKQEQYRGVRKGKMSLEDLEKALEKAGRVEQKDILKPLPSVSAREKLSVPEKEQSAQTPPVASPQKAGLPTGKLGGCPRTSCKDSDSMVLNSKGAISESHGQSSDSFKPTQKFASRHVVNARTNPLARSDMSASSFDDDVPESSDDDYHEEQRDSDVIIESSDEELLS